MRTYLIEQLIEQRVDTIGGNKRKVIAEILDLLGCTRQTLWSIRNATKANPYNLQLEWAKKLKGYFGLEKIDDLLNPSVDKAIIKSYRKKHPI